MNHHYIVPGEMAQHLRRCIAPTEDLSLIPSSSLVLDDSQPHAI